MDSYDELVMLGDEGIDYRVLSDEQLATLALGDELFIATSALSELTKRKSREADRLAQQILTEALGDKYLQAAAIESLFMINPDIGAEFIARILERPNPYLLNTIIQLVLENENYFAERNDATLSIINTLIERIKENSSASVEQDNLDMFHKRYS